MKTLSVAKIKTHLSAVLKEVKSGKEIAVSFGKKKETIAVIIPYENYVKSKKRVLGSLKGKASVEFKSGFKMSDKELLNS